jgi:hypothetical protein
VKQTWNSPPTREIVQKLPNKAENLSKFASLCLPAQNIPRNYSRKRNNLLRCSLQGVFCSNGPAEDRSIRIRKKMPWVPIVAMKNRPKAVVYTK